MSEELKLEHYPFCEKAFKILIDAHLQGRISMGELQILNDHLNNYINLRHAVFFNPTHLELPFIPDKIEVIDSKRNLKMTYMTKKICDQDQG